MSGLYNQKLKRLAHSTQDLKGVSRHGTRELIRLNRSIDPKYGIEQMLVAREIAQGHYVDADQFIFNELPPRLYKRLPHRALAALVHDGRIRIDTFALNQNINAADLPDTPESPYILAHHQSQTRLAVPITLGRRALVFRASLDPYAHLRRYRGGLSIDDPGGFVSCVTQKLNQILSQAGSRIIRLLHAPCVYQWSRLVGTERPREADGATLNDPEDAKYFIKPGYGFHDAEFRFVWILDQDFEGHVEIQCPDLPAFCSSFTEFPA